MKIVFFLVVVIIAVALIYSFIGNVNIANVNKNSLVNFLRSAVLISTPKHPTSEKKISEEKISISKLAPSAAPVTVSTTIYSPQISNYQIPNGFKITDLSPYFSQVKIASAYNSPYSSNPWQIQIYSYLQNSTATVDITGWVIRGNHGTLTIPKAIAVYNPIGSLDESDILFGANQNLYIYGGTSPINKNLRLNKCTGYLSRFYNFSPPLPQNCPMPYNDRSEIDYLAGYCQNYIMSLYSCKLPDVNFYNNLPGTIEGNACRDYLNTINHSACFQKHKNDSDFFSSWYVWINRYQVLDSYHDHLLLFDQNGLLVDEYNY